MAFFFETMNRTLPLPLPHTLYTLKGFAEQQANHLHLMNSEKKQTYLSYNQFKIGLALISQT